MSFEKTVAALAAAIAAHRCGQAKTDVSSQRVADFVLGQYARMPDYLRLPLKVLTLAFSLSSVVTAGRRFHRLSPERQRRQVSRWRESRWGPCRDLMKFYESLVIFATYAESVVPAANRLKGGTRDRTSQRQSAAGR